MPLTEMLHLDPDKLAPLLLPASPPLPVSPLPQAAVLLLLCPSPSPFTLLTRRSAALSRHAGQISLPGGRVDSADASLEATALREAAEETGLDPGGVRLLGRLPTVEVSSSGFLVTPVVGWSLVCPDWRADPGEVTELIEMPLSIVLDPDAYREDTIVTDNIKRRFYFIEYNNYYVWGATARILRSLALTGRGVEPPRSL